MLDGREKLLFNIDPMPLKIDFQVSHSGQALLGENYELGIDIRPDPLIDTTSIKLVLDRIDTQPLPVKES